MKKIGILTFHNVPNYGAILQTYALSQYIKITFNECVNIIDFTDKGNGQEFYPKIKEKNIIKESSNIFKGIIKYLIYIKVARDDYNLKFEKFSEFRKEYLIVDKNLNSIKDNYKLFICGSDQIWNPNITGDFKDYYFGLDEKQNNIKTISYAASCGSLDEIQDKATFLNKISNLKKIGVREKSLYNFIIDNGLFCVHTIDPTFLLTKDQYINYFNLSKNNDTYLLVYALQENPLLLKYAEEIAKIHNLEIKVVAGYIPKTTNKTIKFDSSPIEFLSYVYNASYILTNSFHGLAFSLIFKKQFNVVMPQSRGSRITDLLCDLNLENKIIDDDINVEFIDYKAIDEKLNVVINESKKYLHDALLEELNGSI